MIVPCTTVFVCCVPYLQLRANKRVVLLYCILYCILSGFASGTPAIGLCYCIAYCPASSGTPAMVCGLHEEVKGMFFQ